MGPAVIRGRYTSEPLLSRSIPNLQFDGFPFSLNCADFLYNFYEVDPDARDVTVIKDVVTEALQKTRFARS